MKEETKEESKIKFNNLSKGDLFIFKQNESFGTMKVLSVKDEFDKSKSFLISLPDRSEVIIKKSDTFHYNCNVIIKSKYQKRSKNKNKVQHLKIA